MNTFTNHPDEQMLSAYHDGQLDAESMRSIRAHLDGCDPCMIVLRQLAAVSDLLVANAPGLTPMGRARLHQHIDSVVNTAGDSALIRFGMRISGVAASVLIAGLIALLFAGRETQSISQSMSPSMSQASPPPWVGVATSSDADSVVRNADTPAAAIYLANASSSDGN